MRHVPFLLAYAGALTALFGCLAHANQKSTNAGLPIVSSATPSRHGFVCTPTPTSQVRPVRQMEIIA